MTEYKIKATSHRDCILTKDNQELGKLDYQKWFSFDAVMTLANGCNYDIKPKGFWGTTIELKKEDAVLLHFKMHWNGSIVLHSLLESIEQDFVFKPKGFLQSSYLLKDKDGETLLEVRPHFDWKKFSYQYDIMTSDEFDKFSHKEELMLITIHCANYYMAMMSSAGGAAAVSA